MFTNLQDVLQPQQQQGGGLSTLYGLVVNASRTIPLNVSVLYELVAFLSAFALSIFPG
jgi:hypothetical protein